MPGEPVSRSIGFVIENKAELGKTWKAVYKTFLKPMFTKGTSVIAVNEKDEIVGEHDGIIDRVLLHQGHDEILYRPQNVC